LIDRDSVSDFSYNPYEWKEFLKNASDIIFEKDSSLNTFYAWYDELAFQLRFYAISGSKYELPFGAKVQLVDSPIEFLSDWLNKPNYIKIDELEMDVKPTEPEAEYVVKVWVQERNAFGV
jgi:hypothetical protein